MLLLLAACVQSPALPEAEGPAWQADGAIEALDGEGANPLFDESRVHTLDILLSDESLDRLADESEPYSSDPVYVVGDVVWDGHRVDEVGVRLKGRWGTWRPLSEKPSFKIDLNRFVPGQEIFGAGSLTINNLIVDCSYLRESLAYPLYRAMGVPAPRTAFVQVRVNDEPYGLYLHVETPDERYLARWFDDPSGALYDADYILWGDGSYTILDLYAELIGHFELEEGEDPDRAGLVALVEALDRGGPDLYADTAGLVDWGHHQRQVAAEMWVGQVDGYSLNRNNYLLYLDPSDGLARVLPWDHDYSFIHAADWGFDWRWPQGRLTARCLGDAACRADLLGAVREAMAAAEALDLPGRAATLSALIDEQVDDDRRRDCRRAEVRAYREDLDRWLQARNDELSATWGL